MTTIRTKLLTAALLLALGSIQAVTAATITTTLGNSSPGFNDGDTPATFPDLVNAQSGQPAPFDAGIGNDALGTNFSASWEFNYAPIALPDVITAATLTFGIADHDSGASGSQVDSFTVGASNLSGELDALFEAGGGSGDGEYNVYSLSLGPGLFADMADGNLLVSLALAGPGLQTPLFPLPGPNPPQDSAGNGAHLIYSSLEIQTQVVPIPAAAPLFASALVLMGLYRRRVQRNAA